MDRRFVDPSRCVREVRALRLNTKEGLMLSDVIDGISGKSWVRSESKKTAWGCPSNAISERSNFWTHRPGVEYGMRLRESHFWSAAWSRS